jgi:hypothetical protein
MTYRTGSDKINEVGTKEAWDLALTLDHSLRGLDPGDRNQPEFLREAMTSLARRVLELEAEKLKRKTR